MEKSKVLQTRKTSTAIYRRRERDGQKFWTKETRVEDFAVPVAVKAPRLRKFLERK
jgi:hypothetical protein